MTDPREVMAIVVASHARQRCICLEEEGRSSCQCPVPIPREQIGRLRAFLSVHPDRAVIYSELAGEWLAVLHAFLPQSEDPIAAWLRAPFSVPPAADLHHAVELGTLLDGLGAPTSAIMS